MDFQDLFETLSKGSSGDGKSELFRRIHARYSARVRFHLDATHSFDPHKGVIQTLDEQFSAFRLGKLPLVVGINIGMLGNYAADTYAHLLQPELS